MPAEMFMILEYLGGIETLFGLFEAWQTSLILEYLGGIETFLTAMSMSILSRFQNTQEELKPYYQRQSIVIIWEILEYLGGIETLSALPQTLLCPMILEYLGGIETMIGGFIISKPMNRFQNTQEELKLQRHLLLK